MKNPMNRNRRNGREACPPEGFGVWCRIEDLSAVCGYDPVAQFDLLMELPDVYPAAAGRDPDELAEEHPMQALACAVRRYLAEYPEAAAKLSAAGAGSPKAA